MAVTANVGAGYIRAVQDLAAQINAGDALAVMPNQPDSTATTVELLVADFNDLLAALKTAGYMEPDA
jgi:hypothetical protein